MRLLALATVSALGALGTGCYRPSVAGCAFACSAEETCPHGMTCGSDGFCHESGSVLCSERPDAPAGLDGGADAPPGGPSFVRTFGNTWEDVGRAVSAADGRIRVAGSFQSYVLFDSLPLTGSHTGNATDYDAFAIALDPAGLVTSALQIGSGAVTHTVGYGLASGTSGWSIVGTANEGAAASVTLDFGGGISGMCTGAFAATFDAADSLSASACANTGEHVARAVALGPDGARYLAGSFMGELSLGGTAPNLTSSGNDGFVAKIDAAGDPVWANAISSSGYDDAHAIALASNGELIVVGEHSGASGIGATPAGTALFVAQLDPDVGGILWATSFDGPGDDAAYAVATGSNTIWVTGRLSGLTDFGSQIVDARGFLAKLALDTHVVAAAVGLETTATLATGRALAERDGTVALAGFFDGSASIAGGELVSAGQTDAWVALFRNGGVLEWARRFGGPLDDQALAVAFDPNGRVLVTGSFSDRVDFGQGEVESAGGKDIFVVGLAP